jgi:Phytochelatin synthase
MDVARFKYSAHWVSLDTVWHAMRAIEQATGKVSCHSYSKSIQIIIYVSCLTQA